MTLKLALYKFAVVFTSHINTINKNISMKRLFYLAVAIVIAGFALQSCTNDKHTEKNGNSENGSKILVCYFSATERLRGLHSVLPTLLVELFIILPGSGVH